MIERRVLPPAHSGRMILYHAPRSPFALKVRVCMDILGWSDRVDLVAVDPWTDEGLRSLNPLCQVPTIVSDRGETLFGSTVIVRYLNDRAAGRLFPDPPALWGTLAREAAADGMVSATVRRFVERLDAPSERTQRVILRQEAAIRSVLDDAERRLAGSIDEIDVGHVALAAAISYLDRRSPELQWRVSRPILSRWYDEFLVLPSAAILSTAAED